MPHYLKMAERIYANVSRKKGFSNNVLEDLNNLMIELRAETKGTDLKLICKYIDFNELSVNPIHESMIKIDLSIIPQSRNSQEFILWLAGFIEKITLSEKKKFPPLKENLSSTLQVDNNDNLSFELIEAQNKINYAEEIVNYFKNTKA